MKRPRTRIAEAIAVRGYHAHMQWIHTIASNKYPWNSEIDRNYARWIINKEIDKPKKVLII